MCLAILLCSSSLLGNIGQQQEQKDNFVQQAKIIIEPVRKTAANLKTNPVRLYVRGNGLVQRGAQIIIRIKGIKPYSTIYWSFLYQKGRYNERSYLFPHPFSACSGYSFDSREQSSVADKNGESAVFFRGSTYAGDKFQVGASLDYKQYNRVRFANATIKSKPIEIWKRIYLEQPKVLKYVRFPLTTWNLVCDILAKINIEVNIYKRQKTTIIDPSLPDFKEYFSIAEGTGQRRYGPRSTLGLGISLGDLNMQTSDGSFKTVNVMVLGAVSQNHDLIRDKAFSSAALPPCPVDYEYNYKKRDVNPDEFLSYGSAIAQLGSCPSIVIWSDYWWIFSKIVKVPHDQVMARAILHEIGHHLLRKVPQGTKGTRADVIVLDKQGHVTLDITDQRSLMNGYCLLSVTRRGRVFLDRGTIAKERKFIKNPTWHPEVERLIRQYYIPLKQ